MSNRRVHDRQPATLLLLASTGVLLTAGYRSLLVNHAKLTHAATVQTTPPTPLILDDRWQAVGPTAYARDVLRQADGRVVYAADSAYLLLIPGIDVTPYAISQAGASAYYHGVSQPVLIAGTRYNGIYLSNPVVRLIATRPQSILTYGTARIPLAWASNLHGKAVVSLPPLTSAATSQIASRPITIRDGNTGQALATVTLTTTDIRVSATTYTLTPAGKQKIITELAGTGISYSLAPEPLGTITTPVQEQVPPVSSRNPIARQNPTQAPAHHQLEVSGGTQQAATPTPSAPATTKQTPSASPRQAAPAISARPHRPTIAPVHFGTVTVRYLDKRDGHVLETEQFTGVVGQPILFDTATIVSKYLPQHYVVRQDDTLPATVFTPGHTTLDVTLQRVLPATAKPKPHPAAKTRPKQPRAKPKARRNTSPAVVLNPPLAVITDAAAEPGGDPATATLLARYFQALSGTINLAK